MTCISIAANTTLVLLELIFEIICLRQICSRHAHVELLSKWYHGSPNNSEIRLRLLDNCYNLYYRDETSNLDVTEEIFTFLTINNLNLVETGGLVDFSLILGNHVDSYLYGLLAVSNIWLSFKPCRSQFTRGAGINMLVSIFDPRSNISPLP